jgi:tetratricopeptide (TPR) repeat protein
MIGLLVVLVGIIALISALSARDPLQEMGLLPTDTPTPTATPTATPTLTPTPTPPFPPKAEDEVLIVIATFHHTEGVANTAAHDEIKRAIEQEAGSLNLRVEVAPKSLKADDREGANALGDRYDASLVIWGQDTGVRVSVNFYNRKQPDVHAADVQIEETSRTQIAAPSEYAAFVTQDLPQQLTFLALFAVGQSYYAEEAYEESARVIEKAVAVLERQADVIEGAADAYFRLGWLYYGPHSPLDDLEKARANYNHVLELDFKNSKAYHNRGVIYYVIGEYRQALGDFTHALELNSENATFYYSRGRNIHRAYGMKRNRSPSRNENSTQRRRGAEFLTLILSILWIPVPLGVTCMPFT